MTPMLQQKLERHSGGLPGYSGLLPPPSQRRVLAPANADQRKSTTSTGLQLQCSDLPPSPLLGLSLGDRRLAGGLLVQHSLLAGSGSGLGGRGHSSSEGDEWRRGLSAAAGHGLDGWACSEDEDGGAVAFSDGLASPALQPQPWEQQGFQGQPLGSAAAGATAGGPWLPSEDDAAIERLFEGPSSRSRGEAGGRLQGLLQPGEAQRSPAGPQWQQQQLFGEQEPGSGWWDEEPGAGGAAAAAQDSLAGWLPASPGFAEAAAQQRGQQALLDSLVQGDAALLPPLQRMQQAPQLRLGLARQQGGGALNFLAPSPQRHF